MAHRAADAHDPLPYTWTGPLCVFLASLTALAVVVACGASDEHEGVGQPAAAGAQQSLLPGITAYAGSGSPRFKGDGGPANEAGLFAPIGLAVGGDGDLYIAADKRVRKVDALTGIITTVAGSGSSFGVGDGGPALQAGLRDIRGVAADSSGNVFIADNASGSVRKVEGATGIITTVAGGSGAAGNSGGATLANTQEVGDGLPATQALVRLPDDVAVDNHGNIYIAALNRIRRVDAATGIIETVAGIGDRGLEGDGGPANEAGLAEPVGVAVDEAGNVFIADRDNHRIRRIDALTGIITTVAGIGRHARRTDYAYMGSADSDTATVRSAALGAGYSGDGGPATEAMMSMPTSIAVDHLGNLYLSEGTIRIRKVDAATGVITTIAAGEFEGSYETGKILVRTTVFGELVSVTVDSDGALFFADFKNNVVHKVSAPAAR